MIILAFDSAAKVASAAVTDDERLLGLYTVENGLTQSELLLPMIENLLKTLKLGYEDIGLFATATGPGSFTGVRIGAALLKGLAFGRGAPCVGVSTLEELAENARGLDGLIAPVMDARRGQFYNALFRAKGGELERLTDDRAISADALAEELSRHGSERPYLLGDGYELAKALLRERGIATEETPPLLIGENAYSLARVALRAFRAGHYSTDAELMPTYLRLPQAERERLEREAKNHGTQDK